MPEAAQAAEAGKVERLPVLGSPMILVGEEPHWTEFCEFINDMSAGGTIPITSFNAKVKRVQNVGDLDAVLSYALKFTDTPHKGVSTCSD